MGSNASGAVTPIAKRKIWRRRAQAPRNGISQGRSDNGRQIHVAFVAYSRD